MEYLYLDLQPVREEFDKSREVYISEEDADVVATAEIEAPPDLVWRLANDRDKAPQWAPTLRELEPLSGEYGKVGSVHTCLHGGGIKMVHLRVAVDETGRRTTDRLWNVPLVNEAYLTFEAQASPMGTRAAVYYSFTSNIPIAGQIARSIFIRTSKRHAEDDIQGLKALCEAEVRALEAAREATETTPDVNDAAH